MELWVDRILRIYIDVFNQESKSNARIMGNI